MAGLVRIEINKRDLARLAAMPAVVKSMELAVNKVLREEAKIQKAYLNLPTSNWKKEHKPKWKTQTSTTTKRIAIDLKTDSVPYVFLEQGTRIRYRVMSQDWISKTTPNSLIAGPGRGKAKGFGRRPGIEKRKWREKVFKIRASIFQNKIRRAIALALRPAFPDGTGRTI
jgi:hypothetical protein